MKGLLKRLIPHALWEGARHAFSYTRRFLLDFAACRYLNPLRWVSVFSLVRLVRPRYSMVAARRLRLLYDLARRIEREDVPGAIVECGVYNGGSAAIMAYATEAGARPVWLFDSFEGLPEPTENDGEYEREHYYEGWCLGAKDMVHEIFERMHIAESRLQIVEGWFDKTFPTAVPKVGDIALLHIDADWYESVKICLEHLYPKVVPGGYIVLDDYGAFPGCRKALHEYLDTHGIKAELLTNDGAGRHFRKPLL
ncbi:MAG: class I SAM-dependent methyltransferase [Candidatus Pacebacteria bacterium]|nr:class I SAM-dependent methyltransferase [Candidatus Paceibacterota bacterium]MBP9840720.1 class I SAM-dependent methyltransferase [Candidatus Paceibacterota bacterium]